MKSVLIAYATREGQTEKIARQLAQHFRDAGAATTIINAADAEATASADLDGFDLVVFGASMHAGGLEKELIRYMAVNKEQIERMKRSFFLVLLSAATKDQDLRARSLEEARRNMEARLPIPFPDTEMIAGALMYSRYSPPVKWIMKRIARKSGGDTDTSKDYEYTDWEQVERYAQRLLSIN